MRVPISADKLMNSSSTIAGVILQVIFEFKTFSKSGFYRMCHIFFRNRVDGGEMFPRKSCNVTHNYRIYSHIFVNLQTFYKVPVIFVS